MKEPKKPYVVRQIEKWLNGEGVEKVESKKGYTIKPPSRKVLKKHWKRMEAAQDVFYADITQIEKQMEGETGIKGIEFFRSPDDGCYCGIGNVDRTMKLIQDLRG